MLSGALGLTLSRLALACLGLSGTGATTAFGSFGIVT